MSPLSLDGGDIYFGKKGLKYLKSSSLAFTYPEEDAVLSSSTYGEEPYLSIDEQELESDDKLRKRYIQREIEAMARKTKEYKTWVKFIRATLSVDFQCYHTGISQDACTIHIHHHPYTLYDLCDLVMMNSTDYTTFDIAKIVMKLHFMNLVGFIPLCATSHESYHSGQLNIPHEVIEGNWQDLPKYLKVPDRLLRKIEERTSYTLEDCGSPWAVKEPMYNLSPFETESPTTTKHVDLNEWD